MRKVLIKYNPYKVETNIIIDGKPIKQNSSLNVEDVRLQEWVEELPQRLVDECNTKRYDITFHGTLLDYEDLVSVIQENKGSPVFKSCYQQTISVDIAIQLAGFSCLRLEVIRQVINCHYRHIMQFSELNNLWCMGHAAIVISQFTQHTCWLVACQCCQIDRGFGMTTTR